MKTQTRLTGCRLKDVQVDEGSNGHLNALLLTDCGTVELLHNGFEPHTDEIGKHPSWLPDDYAEAIVTETWTDDESLFIVLDDNRCIVYEFTLGDSRGSVESLRFVSDDEGMQTLRKYFQDPDVRKID